MKITELLKKENILINLDVKNRDECLDIMAEKLLKSGDITNKKAFLQAIMAREEQGTTAVGEGIAIPHAKTKSVKKAALCAAVLKNGINWGAFDGDSRLVFMIAAPEGAANTHLEALSSLSAMLMRDEARETLLRQKRQGSFLI